MTSSRPYLLRCFYEWLNDNHATPYILVDATLPNVFVPQQYVEDGRIVFNISPDAVFDLEINNIELKFDATFSGISRHISVPIRAIQAIYAKEDHKAGMSFGDEPGGDLPPDNAKYERKKGAATKKSHLKIVK